MKRARAQAEAHGVEVEYVSAPREFEELLGGGGKEDGGPAEPDREEDEGVDDARGGLGSARGGGGGGLGFVPAGGSAPGLGSSGARAPLRPVTAAVLSCMGRFPPALLRRPQGPAPGAGWLGRGAAVRRCMRAARDGAECCACMRAQAWGSRRGWAWAAGRRPRWAATTGPRRPTGGASASARRPRCGAAPRSRRRVRCGPTPSKNLKPKKPLKSLGCRRRALCVSHSSSGEAAPALPCRSTALSRRACRGNLARAKTGVGRAGGAGEPVRGLRARVQPVRERGGGDGRGARRG